MTGTVHAQFTSARACASVLWLAIAAQPAIAANCNVTSVGLTPINDLGSGLYLGQFQGGLYPNGMNVPPPAHGAVGVNRAEQIVPRLPNGIPDPNGKYVLLSIGMSNTTQEFCSQSGFLPCDPWTFMGQAAANDQVNHDELVIVNGAKGGQTASTWDAATDQNYDRVRDEILIPQGLSELQVQAVWAKVANAQPQNSLPAANADANVLLGQMGNIARALKIRYPNVQVVFFSSRIYAGYAQGVSLLNPEPYAYESAFAAKWVIEAQIEQMGGQGIDPIAGDLNFNTAAPWIGWGPYLWADGLIPRSDGLIWECADLANDGTHPSQSGEEKVGTMLLGFMLNSPFAEPWFADSGPQLVPGDINNDDLVNINDLMLVINHWGPCPPPPQACPADIAPPPNGNGFVNVSDLLMVINNWTQ